MSQPDVLPRINDRLRRDPQTYLPLFDVNRKQSTSLPSTPLSFIAKFHLACEAKTTVQFKSLKPEQRAQCILERTKYLAKSDEGEATTKWLTVWLAGDVDANPKARSLFANGLKALKKSGNVRLSILHSGEQAKSEDGTKLSLARLVQRIIQMYPPTVAKQMLHKLFASEETARQVQKSGSLEKIAVHVCRFWLS
jgi:Thioredoxin-like domain